MAVIGCVVPLEAVDLTLVQKCYVNYVRVVTKKRSGTLTTEN